MLETSGAHLWAPVVELNAVQRSLERGHGKIAGFTSAKIEHPMYGLDSSVPQYVWLNLWTSDGKGRIPHGYTYARLVEFPQAELQRRCEEPLMPLAILNNPIYFRSDGRYQSDPARREPDAAAAPASVPTTEPVAPSEEGSGTERPAGSSA